MMLQGCKTIQTDMAEGAGTDSLLGPGTNDSARGNMSVLSALLSSAAPAAGRWRDVAILNAVRKHSGLDQWKPYQDSRWQGWGQRSTEQGAKGHPSLSGPPTLRPRIWLMAALSLSVHSATTFALISFIYNMNALRGFFMWGFFFSSSFLES